MSDMSRMFFLLFVFFSGGALVYGEGHELAKARAQAAESKIVTGADLAKLFTESAMPTLDAPSSWIGVCFSSQDEGKTWSEGSAVRRTLKFSVEMTKALPDGTILTNATPFWNDFECKKERATNSWNTQHDTHEMSQKIQISRSSRSRIRQGLTLGKKPFLVEKIEVETTLQQNGQDDAFFTYEKKYNPPGKTILYCLYNERSGADYERTIKNDRGIFKQ
jgi:hypothetical protein